MSGLPDPEDTIVAPSTAPGEAAIAVIRLSGPRCLAVADAIFHGSIAPSRLRPRRLHLGEVRHPDGGETVDQVFLVAFRAPRSYTTQDMVEITCHGGEAVVRGVTEAALAAGARPALPGEFTLRAFLGGRLDLAQAEAVAMLVRARTEAQRKEALRQLGGGLSRAVGAAGKRLARVLALAEASIDFPEDDPDAQRTEELTLREIELASGEVEELLSNAAAARIVNHGARVPIVGKPNVGKSSLMNALSGQSRSIVAHEPGTTRDTVELAVDWGGLPVVLIDTAGLGTPTGSAEEQGQRRTREEIRASDLCLVVLDGSAALDSDDSSVLQAVGERELVVLRNKCDLPVVWGESQLPRSHMEVMTVSCLSGEGVRELKNRATERLRGVTGNGDCPLVVSARHRAALEEAGECLGRARRQASRGCWLEEVAEELREARSALRRITGEDAGEELLDQIFSRFCVGK